MTVDDEVAGEVLSTLHLNKSHPSQRPEWALDRVQPRTLCLAHTKQSPL